MNNSRPVCKEEAKPAFIKPSVYFNNLRVREFESEPQRWHLIQYWLALPIAQPKDVKIKTTSDVLPVIPSLGFFGASTLRKWIWGDATNENALQPEVGLSSIAYPSSLCLECDCFLLNSR
jgi:hypothetical protein